MQEVDKIKQKIVKKATVFETGGFKPEYTSTESWIGKVYLLKPFPLRPQPTRDDYPVWDGGGLTREMEVEILELERSGIIESYYDITENQYGHKLGGYPSFCQPGVYFGDNFEFVFQIASDDKARLNIVDSGTMYFAKNAITGEWIFYCDFY
ncbi:DUF1963 domain-containing protein [Sphingobacterium paludis]|uniref:Uncharacterized protein DUF1963 n=1 Tax=Sphingobacterium paludis TaxID=1476465 RepID=A0A4R7CXI8_9SPHI|nr:DUF1963 domain-containing protein [Sphingobacterium paludis]TDS13000.1 uncharacterized protein DUF1963 [Sphingobacterium paludis]